MCVISYLTQHRNGVHSRDEAGEHQGLGQGEVVIMGGDGAGGQAAVVMNMHIITSTRVVISNIDLGMDHLITMSIDQEMLIFVCSFN